VLDDADGLGELRPFQLDVRVPRASKLDALTSAFAELRRAGYQFCTLGDAAARFA
jgi:hypothetical protein